MNDHNNPATEQEMHNGNAILTIVVTVASAVIIGFAMQEPARLLMQALGG